MTEPERDLRALYAETGEGVLPRDDCPTADALWAAQEGELAVDARQAIVDHLATCASCAEDWRVTLETRGAMAAADEGAAQIATVAEQDVTPIAAFPRRAQVWALAAVLLLTVGLGWWLRTGDELPSDPVYRTGSQGSIEAQIEEGTVVGPGPVELRWSAIEGARYRVSMTDVQLDELFRAEGLDEPRVTVPAEALERLADGDRIWWRVEARRDDGAVMTMVPSWLRWRGKGGSTGE